MHITEKQEIREKLFTISQDDFRWETTRGSGKGGQHRNKTDSFVKCYHDPSGSYGQSGDERSQGQNKKLAWKRCIGTKKFQVWLKMEIGRRMLDKEQRKRQEEAMILSVERSLAPANLKYEIEVDGKWTEVPADYFASQP